MTDIIYGLLGVLVMALVTYIPRAVPMALCRRPVKSPFIRSFLQYMPFTVLAAMTFPGILYSTATPVSALIGMAVALLFSYVGLSLLPVALLSSGAVLITEWFMLGWR